MKKIPVKFVVLEPELRPSQRIPARPERLMFSNAAKLMIKDNQLETPVLMSNKSHAIIILSNLTICNKLLFIMNTNTSLPCSKNEAMFETGIENA